MKYKVKEFSENTEQKDRYIDRLRTDPRNSTFIVQGFQRREKQIEWFGQGHSIDNNIKMSRDFRRKTEIMERKEVTKN